MALKLWSHYKFERNESEYQKFDQYDNNYKLVISETKEIIVGLQNIGREDTTFPFFIALCLRIRVQY